MSSFLTLSNPGFKQYGLCSAVLGAKLICVAFLTSGQRIRKGALANPEDVRSLKGKVKTDEDVERIRRVHHNDLENIPVFWVMGLLFLFTEPSDLARNICLYGFTAARICHTVSYLNSLMPARAIFYTIGQAINCYMTAATIYSFL